MTMPSMLLPTWGLAEVYLASTPVRSANQSTMACWAIMTSLMSFGFHTEAVSAAVEVANNRGGVTRYGDWESAEFTDGGSGGHAVLIADGKLIDPTAGQFPEIARHVGVHAVGGDLKGNAEAVLRQGGVLPLRLASDDGRVLDMVYRLGVRGSADAAMTGFLDQPHAREDVAIIASNVSLIFAKLLSSMPGKVVELEQVPVYRQVVARARAMRDRDISFDENGLAHALP
ncbi:hypothetical protein [Mycolicibacterium mageritense]|uniref:hypothetical protein n=1 Tax=Mycolicibacterium mageritense TaxID=53462 RepID=UPI0023EF96FC|nr:hypothetical protein [Mycolicibacterium mageritense]